MSDDLFSSTDSVRSGRPLKEAKSWTLPEPFRLFGGETLPEVTVVYETYGTLNADKTNAVCICHALSGDSHVASHDETDDPGWWEAMVGPGKPIDTNQYFVICSNILGGCRGTTGPDDANPATGKPYGADFPAIDIADIVEVQKRLIHEHLQIPQLLALVGGSLGGFIALDWATRYSDSMLSTVVVATGARMSSQSLAFDIVARNAIMSDPNYFGGQYYDHPAGPATGLAIARMMAHITYLSRESMKRKFDKERNKGRSIESSFETRFSVGSYLAHQGDKFVERFDANSYIAISMALDLFDLGETPEKLAARMQKSACRWLIVSFSSDWLFPADQSKELVKAAQSGDKRVTYCNIKSDGGHDSFLLEKEISVYGRLVASMLSDLTDKLPNPALNPSVRGEQEPKHLPKQRIDYDRIIELIEPGKSVLDLGCGRGDLLLHLRRRGDTRLTGLELDEESVIRCAERGLDVIHADLDAGLGCFYDQQFDYVVLSKTLQSVRNVELVMDEMLRVGKRVIVSFPNVGYYQLRVELNILGRSPQTDTRPGRTWYNTNDVRNMTIDDFQALCEAKGYQIQQMVAIDTKRRVVISDDDINLMADVAIVVLSR